MTTWSSATSAALLLVLLPVHAAASCGGARGRCEVDASQIPLSVAPSLYQSAIVLGTRAAPASEHPEELKGLRDGLAGLGSSLPGLEDLDDEFGGLDAEPRVEARPYHSSLPGLDELEDEFGLGAEVPPPDAYANPPFITGYGATSLSSDWALPPRAYLNLFLVVLQLGVLMAGAALLLRAWRRSRQEQLKGKVSMPTAKFVPTTAGCG